MDYRISLVLLIPVVSIVMGVSLAILWRYWEHKERMAAIEKGLLPARVAETEREERTSPETPRGRLQSGLVTTAAGAALTVGLWTLGFGPWLLAGLIPLFIGLAKILVFLLLPMPADALGAEE